MTQEELNIAIEQDFQQEIANLKLKIVETINNVTR
jgi:hypothetical protein